MDNLQIKHLARGDKLVLSRLLTQVENSTPAGVAALEALYPLTGKAYLIGITGSPGSGKSTLVNAFVSHLREHPWEDKPVKIAVIAVDPSSPYTGGAILGDRIRMRDIFGDPNIFIRSMASRGALGGLSHTTAAFTQVLDAAGYEIIIIETVGAGQSEVEIAGLAHSVVVVESPGDGDEIQAIKAGILETADILVVNKADYPYAQNTIRALRTMLNLSDGEKSLPQARKHLFNLPFEEERQPVVESELSPWLPPIIPTIALKSEGMAELAQALYDHKTYLLTQNLWHKREERKIQRAFDSLLRDVLAEKWAATVPPQLVSEVLNQLYQHKIGPHAAVDALLAYNQGL